MPNVQAAPFDENKLRKSIPLRSSLNKKLDLQWHFGPGGFNQESGLATGQTNFESVGKQRSSELNHIGHQLARLDCRTLTVEYHGGLPKTPVWKYSFKQAIHAVLTIFAN